MGKSVHMSHGELHDDPCESDAEEHAVRQFREACARESGKGKEVRLRKRTRRPTSPTVSGLKSRLPAAPTIRELATSWTNAGKSPESSGLILTSFHSSNFLASRIGSPKTLMNSFAMEDCARGADATCSWRSELR